VPRRTTWSRARATRRSQTENLTAARSRIQDIDVAQETSELVRSQILVQVGTSVLSAGEPAAVAGARACSAESNG
jgi:hypothetical protein